MIDPPLDHVYVAARRVLLDALVALDAHSRAVIVVGAQAIYLRTADEQFASVAPFTTDSDLTLDPGKLTDLPRLETAMREANFELRQLDGGNVEPGTWVRAAEIGGRRYNVPVDLIVPAGAAPRAGRRGARLGGHGNQAARKIAGLEAALVDFGPMEVTALEPEDGRRIVANVAGEAALLIAKLHKLQDRTTSGNGNRLHDKDAADVIRLMQATSPSDVGFTIARLSSGGVASEVSKLAVGYLKDLFGGRNGAGVKMAAQALRLGLPEGRIAALSIAYTRDLAEALATEASRQVTP